MSKTILIAGCCGNVGKAAIELFQKNDWNVAGIDIKAETSDVDKFIQADVRNAEEIAKAVDEIDKEMKIDALLNAAGYEINKDFEEVTADEWADLLDTVLGGAGNLCKAAAPKMIARKGGKIILLSPDYSREGGDNVINATAANTLHGFAKSFGVEMAPSNVLVNVLFANTPLDIEKVTETVLFLADRDTYTSAQVVSISGADV